MSIQTTCPSCSQEWAVVPGIRKAHPGRTSAVTEAVVRNEDVFGNPTGGVSRVPSAHWISAGPSADLSYEDDGGLTVAYRWTCLCGHPLAFVTPALETVECAPGGTPCHKAAGRRKPLGYTLPSEHGGAWQACACCGHQGSHTVRRDRQGHLPPCLSGWDGSYATRPR
jgi:hypothetical protein